MSQLKPLMEKNFLEYASYVIIDRAIPQLRDGCKPVQRRILYTLMEMHDGKFHKVANVIGETMKLHPHGDGSIGDALVVLANKDYFIEKQGNFGNVLTGHDAAASRYIECRLTPLAVDTLFNKRLTEHVPSYDGRKKEPHHLPAKIPVLLMLGIEGIAVGMSTRVLPHNFVELLDAQVKLLQRQPIEIYPDFPQGCLVDVAEYEDGAGKVKIRAKIDRLNDKKLVIREIAYSTTTTSLISSIENAIQKGRVGIASISDFTTDHVEIELTTSRGVNADEVLPQLYAYTDCEVSISSNIVAIRNNRPIEINITDYLKEFNSLLKEQIRDELTQKLEDLESRQHWLTLEQIFIVNRGYKRIEQATSEKQVKAEVHAGMKPFSHLFLREMTDDDVARLLDIRIRRISAYDIDKNRQEMKDIAAAIKDCKVKLKALTKTTIAYITGLKDKYEHIYPRQSEIAVFSSVDKKSVAVPDIKLGYDRETGFFGSSVKSEDRQLVVTEYDRILLVTADGKYRIIAPPEKILLPTKLLYCSVFNQEIGARFMLVYRDSKKLAWGKKVHIEKFITDRVYELCKGSPTGIDYLTNKKEPGLLKLRFVPTPRQRVKESNVDLKTVGECGIAARGTRLHAKPVRRVTLIRNKAARVGNRG